MSRPLRIEFIDALYHVTSRGNRSEHIFADDSDRCALLAVFDRAFERFHATAFAYCLMGNHYHIVVQTHQPNLSRLMRHINGVYTQTYNRRHSKIGHVFQGRFNAILVQRDAYFLEVCRYVDLNPVRAGIVKQPVDWPWSSYSAHTGRVISPRWLDSAALYRQLVPHLSEHAGARSYARFVAQGQGVKLWEDGLAGQIYLGDATFVRAMQARATTPDEAEIPLAHRQSRSQSVQHYLAGRNRDAAIARAYLEGGYPQSAIARATGLSLSRISRIVSAFEAKSKT